MKKNEPKDAILPGEPFRKFGDADGLLGDGDTIPETDGISVLFTQNEP